ncbi:MAG TPA: RNA polymerase factor sigma-54 [Longimicrobiales bacterium]|nr:RNA polymerase factor sigma-54 [Longimicrobiales bacterium]
MSGFDTRLFQGQQLKQEMRINPRLYQAMELLYMPLQDLEQHLKQEMAENPFLELEQTDTSQDMELVEEQPDDQRNDEEIDWEEILLDGFDAGGRKQEYEHKEYVPPTAVVTEDLEDFLLEQLHLLALDERDMRLGEELIGNLDDAGLVACSLDEVLDSANAWLEEAELPARRNAEAIEDEEEREAELAEIERLFRPYTMEEAEEVLERIQRFEPAGVGARTIRECILIQMRQAGMEDTPSWTLVDEHFNDLVNHKWADIARATGMTKKEVQTAADELQQFDPKPGLSKNHDPEQYVIPDLIVEKIDGEYMVFANDGRMPRLRISQAYREVAKNKADYKGENKEFITSKLNAANWMIQAIEQRRQTMLKVMRFIVDRQREFFEKGVQSLRPLTLREVADHIDMHESTVSRVTNEKYVQTPRGVFSLKYFFSSGLSTASGEDISARGVQDKIKILIEEEDSAKPLTDSALVRKLKEDGVKIARRTVAKYRDQMGILPARMRKRV